MTKNNLYKGVGAWMQAMLEASQSNTLGDWWNARTLECINLGIELSVANELAVYEDGLSFTKALHSAAKQGLLTQQDVDYNTNVLLSVRWKFDREFFHLEEMTHLEEMPHLEEHSGEYQQAEVEQEDVLEEEAVITFSAMKEEASVEAPPVVEQQVVAEKPKGGRPKKAVKN